jgi:sugar/nucleoside kinase (ribokinase family)
VIAETDERFLESQGLVKGSMALIDADQARALYADMGPAVECSGGSAANTVMGVADFGGTAAFAGKVGANEIGEFFQKDMREMGVAMEVAPAEGESGTCVVLISEDAQRTMLTHLGVSSTLGPDDIIEAEIQKAKYVYIEGYLFTGDSTKAAAYKAIELAKKNNVKVAFTVSDPFLINLFKEEFMHLFGWQVEGVDYSAEYEFATELGEAQGVVQLIEE